MLIDDFRWDEKFRLRGDALSCQALGALEAQEIEKAYARPSRRGREFLVENLCVEEVNHAERRTPQDGVLPIAGV